jgi:hypothetical protein
LGRIAVVTLPEGTTRVIAARSAAVAISPDGRLVAFGGYAYGIQVVRVSDGVRVAEIESADFLARLAFSPLLSR